MKNKYLSVCCCIYNLLLFAFFLSCSESDVITTNTREEPSYTDTSIKLLIKGQEVSLPTKGIKNDIEQDFTSDLLTFILKKDNNGVYRYESWRPVEERDGSYSVKIPNSLDQSDLKLLLFANSREVLGDDPDKKFKTDGIGMSESDLRSQVFIKIDSKWNLNRAIPMWGEDAFSFSAPDASAIVADLSLVRMLARVDVGLNYKDNTINADKLGLPNFRLHAVKVYNTHESGQLLPNLGSFSVTGKKVSIEKPSVPLSASKLDAYEVSAKDSTRGFEKEIYLFEQDNQIDDNTFKVGRPCILVQGSYITDTGIIRGWYRIDFYNFSSSMQFSNILRNTLYRFNIKSVSGPGFASPNDALNSISSNITVDLQAYDLTQNDIVFDGQYFLSVNKSELFFYEDKITADFNFTTDYKQGWTIENLNKDIEVSPSSGTEVTPVISVTWKLLPTAREDKPIYIKAGNLKKEIILRYMNEKAPGYLERFTLTPSTLYFSRDGGTGQFEVNSNLSNFFLSKKEGALSFNIPSSPLQGSIVNTSVSRYNGPLHRDVENGVVDVQVNASNASLSAQCNILQLTYDKSLSNIGPTIMSCDPVENTNKAELRVFFTPEKSGKYMLQFKGENGGDNIDKRLAINDYIDITALPNRTKDERQIGILTFTAAEDGHEIPLIGFKPIEVPIRQKGTPPPSVSISAYPKDDTNFTWNKKTAVLEALVKDINHVNGKKEIALSYSGEMFANISNPTSTTHALKMSYDMNENRSATSRTGTITASVNGYDNQIGKSSFSVTQSPALPSSPPVVPDLNIIVGWQDTNAKLVMESLSNIYDIKVQAKSAVDNTPELPITHDNLFTLTPDRSSAELNVSFSQNITDKDRKIRIVAKATGNIASEFYTRTYTITQSGQKNGQMEILGNNPLTLPWEQLSYEIDYTAANMKEESLIVSSNASWLSVTLSSGNKKKIVCNVGENTTGAIRSAEIKLQGVDLEGNTILSNTLKVTQEKNLTGKLELAPGTLTFERTASIDYSSIIKENIAGTIRVDNDKTTSWLSKSTPSGDKLTVRADENFGHAREGRVVIFGSDFSGVEKTAVLTVKQNSNIVRVNSREENSPYKHDEGEGNPYQYPDFRLYLESNSLEFDPSKLEASVSSEAQKDVYYFSYSGSRDINGKQYVRVELVPTKRMTSYKEVKIPVTFNFKTTQGVPSSAIITFIRQGHPKASISTSAGIPDTYTGPASNGHIDPGQSVEFLGLIDTKNLKPNSAITVKFTTTPSDPTNKGVTISKTLGLGAVEANASVSVRIRVSNGSNSYSSLNESIDIVGEGVDGKPVILKTIVWKGK